MNERIRELAEQAGVNLSSFQFSGTPTKYEVAESELEKFAELIVRECVAVVDDMADPEDSDPYFWTIQNASQKIKQHFGVEE